MYTVYRPSTAEGVGTSHLKLIWVRGLKLRPVHLLKVSLLRVLESNFPGDSLYNYMDMIIPTPEN